MRRIQSHPAVPPRAYNDVVRSPEAVEEGAGPHEVLYRRGHAIVVRHSAAPAPPPDVVVVCWDKMSLLLWSLFCWLWSRPHCCLCLKKVLVVAADADIDALLAVAVLTIDY